MILNRYRVTYYDANRDPTEQVIQADYFVIENNQHIFYTRTEEALETVASFLSVVSVVPIENSLPEAIVHTEQVFSKDDFPEAFSR